LLRLRTSLVGKQKFFTSSTPDTLSDLEFLKELIEQDRLKSVIDRQFSLEDIKDAHIYAETEQIKGNIVILVDPSASSQETMDSR
jgi:NADPH:quinone reductase-like Zn-dependent oxidoreductase